MKMNKEYDYLYTSSKFLNIFQYFSKQIEHIHVPMYRWSKDI